MPKTPIKKPTPHAVVPKKGKRVVVRPGAKKKCHNLQGKYKSNMARESCRNIDDSLSLIVKFVRGQLKAGKFQTPAVGGLTVPSCRNLRDNFSQMLKGGDKVFCMPKIFALLAQPEAFVAIAINSELHCFVLYDKETSHYYVIDAGSKNGTTVQQDDFEKKLFVVQQDDCEKKLPSSAKSIAVLPHNRSFFVRTGGVKKSFFYIEESSTPFEDSRQPFVPNITRKSLRPRKKD